MAGADVCESGEGDLTISDLPAGSSVIKCDAVGRVVTYDDTGLTVPEPGTAVSIDALATDGGTHGFTMEVASDGKVSYDLTESSADNSTAGTDVADVRRRGGGRRGGGHGRPQLDRSLQRRGVRHR
ncbi:hypothetical protein AB0M32_09200 [Streptomyces sp. NPDC051985]|uniref:hypothetical protein n=1 Tax=Streptomyces sp. NPDC051985 TaxID=3155807 RepID=UPI00342922D4